MPKGILTRFIVEIHRWIENQTCVWKTGVVLTKDDARAEVIELYRYHKGEIRIRVSGKHPRDLLTTIRHELDKIHATYERLKYNTLVPCNCTTCKSSNSPSFYTLSELNDFLDANDDIQCRKGRKMVKVRGLVDSIAKSSSVKSSNIRDQKKSTALQEEWDLVHEKLTKLRKAFINETDTARKNQLQHEIEETEEHLKRLDNELN